MKREIDVLGVMVVALVIAMLAVILVPAYHDYMCRKSGAADCAEQKAKVKHDIR